jgi:hypothetical protein
MDNPKPGRGDNAHAKAIWAIVTISCSVATSAHVNIGAPQRVTVEEVQRIVVEDKGKYVRLWLRGPR